MIFGLKMFEQTADLIINLLKWVKWSPFLYILKVKGSILYNKIFDKTRKKLVNATKYDLT